MVAALNWLHGGQQAFTTMVPTAAHGRVHSRLEGALRALVMNDEPTLGPERLDSFLRQTQHYTGTGVVLALGARGGVPDKAADVALADELAPHFPDLARQVTSPSCLLLPAKKRPRKVRKGYTWVSSTYPELVRKNVKADAGGAGCALRQFRCHLSVGVDWMNRAEEVHIRGHLRLDNYSEGS